MITENELKNEENNDKTIVFKKTQDNIPLNDDATKIEFSKTKKSYGNEETTFESKINSDQKEQTQTEIDGDQIKKVETKDKGISRGIFAAGVTGAAVSGVGAGVVFSDDIKGVFEAISSDVAENSDTIPEVKEELPAGEIHLNFSDANGLYEISLVDSLGDGQVDTLNMEAQLVDGSTVQFSASGTILDHLFNHNISDLATGQDYLAHCCGHVFEGFTPESLGGIDYQIQYGDTLSEIAAAHGTSVAHIMELNPNIDNPNVIFAGDHLIIPDNDNISNPYEGWNPQWSNSQDYEYLVDNTTIGDPISNDFEEMDWQSFEDQPIDDYSDYLSSENFEDYGSIDSYLNSDNDFSSLDFLI
jgi:hypothetical protein